MFVQQIRRTIASIVCVLFTSTSFAAELTPVASLPAPDQLLPLSESYSFPVMKGVRFNPADPLNLEFVFDAADRKTISKDEARRLIEYFLAGLTVPADDLWVNLSPYESDRIAPDSLSNTDLGSDMLAQDYVLKQLSSSLTYPESEIGQQYWQAAQGDQAGASSLNKIWIVPAESQMYETDTAAYVVNARLKAMTQSDYFAMQQEGQATPEQREAGMNLLLPAIDRQLNDGKHFSTLRQIHYSLLLGMWFKVKFRNTFFESYFDQARTAGIDVADKDAKNKIYDLYCEAFRKGVFNYQRKERDAVSMRLVKRQYFCGGVNAGSALEVNRTVTSSSMVVSSFTDPQRAPVVRIDLGDAKGQAFSASAVNKVFTYPDAEELIKQTGYANYDSEEILAAQKVLNDPALEIADVVGQMPAINQKTGSFVATEVRITMLREVRKLAGVSSAVRNSFTYSQTEDLLKQAGYTDYTSEDVYATQKALNDPSLYESDVVSEMPALDQASGKFVSSESRIEMLRTVRKLAGVSSTLTQAAETPAKEYTEAEAIDLLKRTGLPYTAVDVPYVLEALNKPDKSSFSLAIDMKMATYQPIMEGYEPYGPKLELLDAVRALAGVSSAVNVGVAKRADESKRNLGGVAFTGVGASAITPFTGTVRIPAGFDAAMFDGFTVLNMSDIEEKPVAELIGI